jgi:hypothetical protein
MLTSAERSTAAADAAVAGERLQSASAHTIRPGEPPLALIGSCR